MRKIILATNMQKMEIVCLTLKDALNIQQSDAERIILVGDIKEGGLTPEYNFIKEVSRTIKKEVRVLIRRNKIDFKATNIEFELMKKDVEFCKKNNIKTIVFSVMNENNCIDWNRNLELLEIAKPMQVIFGKGIDYSTKVLEDLKKVEKIGFKGVLMQGGLKGFTNYLDALKQVGSSIISHANFELILAGGIGIENIKDAKSLGFNWFHIGNLVRENNSYENDIDINKINLLKQKIDRECENNETVI